MKRYITLLLLSATLCVSCQKLFYTSVKGEPIGFTASNATLSWTSDDILKISCPEATISKSTQKWADYFVPGGGMSRVSISPKGEKTDLLWGNGLHHFYAASPGGNIDGNVVSANISSVQDSDNPFSASFGYLAATAESIRGEMPVNLVFFPMFTTLEFSVGPGDFPAAVLSGFRLESTGGPLAGGYTNTLSTQGDPSITVDSATTSSEITVNMAPVTIETGQTYRITVIALPKDLSGLTAYFLVNGEERALPLVDQNGNPLVVAAFQRATITADGFLTPDETEGAAKINVTIESQDVIDITLL